MNIERYLNRLVHTSPSSTPVIYAWNEPYGIGGKALVTNNQRRNGCFECLFQLPVDGQLTDKMHDRSSFTEKKQYFAKSILGCGGQFTPFSGLDSLQTAILAVQTAIDILLGKEKENPLMQ